MDETASSERIGWLVPRSGSTIVVGKCCYRLFLDEQAKSVPLYRVNIGDYKQTCHSCEAVLVESSGAWCELFTNPIQVFVVHSEYTSKVKATCAEEAANMVARAFVQMQRQNPDVSVMEVTHE